MFDFEGEKQIDTIRKYMSYKCKKCATSICCCDLHITHNQIDGMSCQWFQCLCGCEQHKMKEYIWYKTKFMSVVDDDD